MSINGNTVRKDTEDFFGDDFEVIYQEDFPDLNFFEDEDDDYRDVLSNLSELDDDDDIDYLEENYDYNEYEDEEENSSEEDKKKRKKHHKIPNLLSPAGKAVKTGGKIIYKTVNLLLRGATLILIAIITYTLVINFWNNYSAYGDIFHAITDKNYILGAYAGVALFLLLFEVITFLMVLSGSKKSGRKGRCQDTGRGLFSFVLIFAGSYLAYLFHGLVPASPAPLQGVQGALAVYGALHTTLLPLCTAGIISCLIRKFLIR